MEEINTLILTDFKAAIQRIKSHKVNQQEIIDARLEFDELDRKIRPSQVGNIQKDKVINGKPPVKAVRIPIPFQNKIVNTSVAFEVGEPPTLIPQDANELTDEVDRLWKVNRMDSAIQKMKKAQKSQLQTAIMFYIQELKPDTIYNRLIGANDQKEIKTKILDNSKGIMTPYFDAFGDMLYFLWEFNTVVDGKTINNAWIYDTQFVYKWNSNEAFSTKAKHGFNKIPIVFDSQEKPEWFIATAMIDRIEVVMSKLGASNDYSAYPILKLYGDVQGSLNKDDDGKAIRLQQKVTSDGKLVSSDAEFLTNTNAPDSIRLEVEKLEKYIYSLTSTPDISFDNIKGMGPISGIAIRLMFLDAMMKAKMNEGDNRTMIERMINVFISGIVTTTGTGMKPLAQETFFTVQFNSILPDDLKETVAILTEGKNAGLISQKTGVGMLGLTDDDEQEINDINGQKEENTDPDNTI